MSITQAGIYKLTLYENKEFSFLYDSNGDITLSSITNTGDVLELETNDNFIKYTNDLKPAGNNAVVNDYLLKFVYNGLVQSNLDIIEKIQSSIYGWIPVIEFMDNQKYLINAPFFEKVDAFNSQVTHTFFIDLKPRIFTLKRLEVIADAESVEGVLAFDGSSYVELDSGIDSSGNKTISFKCYVTAVSGELHIELDTSSVDYFIFDYYGDGSAYISINPGVFGIQYDLSSYLDQIISCIVTKTSNSASLTIDADLISGSSSTSVHTSSDGASNIGINDSGIQDLAYIWDINFNGENNYDAQPDGNLDTAWEDTIGSIDGTVFGSPTTKNLP